MLLKKCAVSSLAFCGLPQGPNLHESPFADSCMVFMRFDLFDLYPIKSFAGSRTGSGNINHKVIPFKGETVHFLAIHTPQAENGRLPNRKSWCHMGGFSMRLVARRRQTSASSREGIITETERLVGFPT